MVQTLAKSTSSNPNTTHNPSSHVLPLPLAWFLETRQKKGRRQVAWTVTLWAEEAAVHQVGSETEQWGWDG